MHNIYTVTAFNEGTIHDCRTWGWFPTFERAKKAIYDSEHNDFIFESGTYKYALIEEVSSGIMPFCEKTWWYRADFISHDEDDEYIITFIEPPEFVEKLINFSMG